jgi:hypothetical protein
MQAHVAITSIVGADNIVERCRGLVQRGPAHKSRTLLPRQSPVKELPSFYTVVSRTRAGPSTLLPTRAHISLHNAIFSTAS